MREGGVRKKRGHAGFSYSSWLLTRVEKKRQADFWEARQGGGDTVMDPHLRRREVLALMGATAVVVGYDPEPSVPRWLRQLWSRKTAATTLPPCIVRPEQTEGPYFVDDRLNRSDIRSDPSDGSVKEGLPLQLALRVHEIRGQACTPLPGAMVDIWHCDALGVYADVRDRFFDTRGKKFLRGYQVTDAAGTVRFLTIYPGWYPVRTVHIHFKIRTHPESDRRPARGRRVRRCCVDRRAGHRGWPPRLSNAHTDQPPADHRGRLELRSAGRGAGKQGASQWAADRGAGAGHRAHLYVRRMGRIRCRRRGHHRCRQELAPTCG